MPRKILLLDLDAFFCAVEELRDPSLRGKPFAVGGSPQGRGVVASCSYPARRFGVRSAMPMSRALALCPKLLVVRGQHHLYSEYSRKVIACMEAISPQVEQVSIDEAFMDVTHLPEPGAILARRLQAIIHNELGLPCSIGVATNKLLAKTASEVGKATGRQSRPDYDGPPMAVLEVPPGEEAAFLAPLPAGMLWGVGPKTAERLAGMGIRTIGDIARWPEESLVRRFGKSGFFLRRAAQGIDDSTVHTEREEKSVSHETTFEQDIADRESLHRTLRRLAEGVGRRLRLAGTSGVTVSLKLRWSDFTTISRQATLEMPTDLDAEIGATAIKLFDATWKPGRPVRLLGVGVSGLGPPVRQLPLWEETPERQRHLQEALDVLRERYGRKVVRRASELEGER
jgi:DNA polymerase IV